MKEEVKYLEDMDKLEPLCRAVKVKSVILYCYPPTERVLELHPKVILPDGRIVKRTQVALKDGVKVIVGELGEERLIWNMEGHLIGDENNEDMHLLVAERYFDIAWRSRIKLSNGEFAIWYQRPHPNVQIPEEWTGKKYKVID